MDIRNDYDKLGEFELVIAAGVLLYILPDIKKVINRLKTKYLLLYNIFYNPELQGYGSEIMKTPEDMLKLIDKKPLEIIEIKKDYIISIMILK